MSPWRLDRERERERGEKNSSQRLVLLPPLFFSLPLHWRQRVPHELTDVLYGEISAGIIWPPFFTLLNIPPRPRPQRTLYTYDLLIQANENKIFSVDHRIIRQLCFETIIWSHDLCIFTSHQSVILVSNQGMIFFPFSPNVGQMTPPFSSSSFLPSCLSFSLSSPALRPIFAQREEKKRKRDILWANICPDQKKGEERDGKRSWSPLAVDKKKKKN